MNGLSGPKAKKMDFFLIGASPENDISPGIKIGTYLNFYFHDIPREGFKLDA